MILVQNSTPTVTAYILLKIPLIYLSARDVFPTPRSPTITTLKFILFQLLVELYRLIIQSIWKINIPTRIDSLFSMTNYISYNNNLIIMFRHLSPKTEPKEKQEIINTKVKMGAFNNHMLTTRMHDVFEQQIKTGHKEKDIKNLNYFLHHNPVSTANVLKVINYPQVAAPPNFTNSSDNLKNNLKKDGSAFDDYYQRNSKYQQKKRKNQDVSNSGDSFQSQGYKALKKPFATISTADKVSPKHKNLVVAPLLNNQELRNGFKSPGNWPQTRVNLYEDLSGKRIGSFGGKKQGISKFLQDNNEVKKQKQQNNFKIAFKTSLPAKTQQNLLSFTLLNLSNHNGKKQIERKVEEQKAVKDKVEKSNVPKFIFNSNIKSSPYLNKYALDSSNEQSIGQKLIKSTEKTLQVPLLQQFKRDKEKDDKKRFKEEDKSLSFNKGEMFSNLKKRQEMHYMLTREINILGFNQQIKVMSTDGDRSTSFLFIKKINQSKNTVIFMASYLPTNSFFCLKRIALTESKSSLLLSTIRQHKIHQLCMHPHIVKYFFSAYDSSHLYLGMQYMQSETLGQQLKQQILRNMSQQGATKPKINETLETQISKVNKIRKILYEITSALNYLHQKSIIHRDVKPENIFVSHDIYKLGDFGSAGLEGQLEYVGTLDYAAPQILTPSPYNCKVDIWSLGCIAYELDVGRPPFFHINHQQTKRLAINGDYDRSLICDNQLRKLIQQMLVVNSRNRLSARQLLKHEFFQRLQQQNNIF